MSDNEVEIIDGECTKCGATEYPVDKNGKKIPYGNCEDALEWRLEHSSDCSVGPKDNKSD